MEGKKARGEARHLFWGSGVERMRGRGMMGGVRGPRKGKRTTFACAAAAGNQRTMRDGRGASKMDDV